MLSFLLRIPKLTRCSPVGNAFIRGVSGGERKRVSLSEMLTTDAAVICWDNAIRGLDSAIALHFFKMIRELSRSTGMTNVSDSWNRTSNNRPTQLTFVNRSLQPIKLLKMPGTRLIEWSSFMRADRSFPSVHIQMTRKSTRLTCVLFLQPTGSSRRCRKVFLRDGLV